LLIFHKLIKYWEFSHHRKFFFFCSRIIVKVGAINLFPLFYEEKNWKKTFLDKKRACLKIWSQSFYFQSIKLVIYFLVKGNVPIQKKSLLDVVMSPARSKIFDPGQVSHLWLGYGFGKFPLIASNFSIFCPSGQKNVIGSGQKVPGSKPGRPLIYCRSKVWSGQCPSLVRWKLTYSLNQMLSH